MNDERISKKTPKSEGLVQLYTGNGKGKTTASLGMAIRAVAKGIRVAIVYFDKGGIHYSERKVIVERFKGEIDFWGSGLDRIDPKTGRFRFGVTDEDKAEAERGLDVVRGILAKPEYGLVILVERDVLDVIAAKPAKTELVLTGRNAPDSFRELADLVTEMTLIKHYFYHGTPAREGLDY
jgi:cob(I)alamin adenosyltransferase